MSKVFVSYKRVDKDKVLPIVHQLDNKLGIKCWMDLDGIESDEQFTNVIIKAIKECEVFLFMFSKSHEDIDTKRDWTVREITFADKKDKRIVFIDLDGNELPDWFLFKFPDQQVVKASDSYAMDKLAKDMCKWLGLPQPNYYPNDQGRVTNDIPKKIGLPKPSTSPDDHGQATETKDNGAVYTETSKSMFDFFSRIFGGALSEAQESSDSHQAIDLGLPSGTKWASCNVGASKPEEYGDYFAWGETEKKKYYDWGSYIHCDGIMDTCHDLGSDISGTKYDVASMKWGGKWRMPTKEQFDELLANCRKRWTILNGVEGCKFTSKINGNSIFLPAAGYRDDSDLSDAGLYGNYWSSAQNLSYAYHAYYLTFGSGRKDWCYSARRFGQSVRPVSRN